MVQLFLDCDGVLADFDYRARQIFGMEGQDFEDRYGTAAFWREIRNDQDFFTNLPLMADAMQLYDAVKHLTPIILTGQPAGTWAAPQKLAWRDEYFPGVEMIVCRSKDKYQHMTGPGDILVDDLVKHKQVWEDNQGIFAVHTSAADSIRQLTELGII